MFSFLSTILFICSQRDCCLASLNLMCNDFGEEGAKHLAEALEVESLVLHFVTCCIMVVAP